MAKDEKDTIISRKAFREYQREQGEVPNENIIHRMNDGRIVDENGEILSQATTDGKVDSERQTAQRFIHNKRYDVDPLGHLTPLGKQQRLKFRLNITITILVLLIIATFLILRFVD